jgi:hypothetical protein
MNGLVPGRIVYFVFGGEDAAQLARDRIGSPGNIVRAGDIYPAMVVRVNDPVTGYVNLKVMLDGPDTYWATSVWYDANKADRSWHWMFEGQAGRHGVVPQAEQV